MVVTKMQTLQKRSSVKELIKNGQNKHFRHGDVLLERINNATEIKDETKLVSTGSMTVAEGELTGHKHTLNPQSGTQVQIYQNIENPDEKYVAVVNGSTVLEHQEHKPIDVEEGLYRVRIEREFDPTTEVSRKVYD